MARRKRKREKSREPAADPVGSGGHDWSPEEIGEPVSLEPSQTTPRNFLSAIGQFFRDDPATVQAANAVSAIGGGNVMRAAALSGISGLQQSQSRQQREMERDQDILVKLSVLEQILEDRGVRLLDLSPGEALDYFRGVGLRDDDIERAMELSPTQVAEIEDVSTRPLSEDLQRRHHWPDDEAEEEVAEDVDTYRAGAIIPGVGEILPSPPATQAVPLADQPLDPQEPRVRDTLQRLGVWFGGDRVRAPTQQKLDVEEGRSTTEHYGTFQDQPCVFRWMTDVEFVSIIMSMALDKLPPELYRYDDISVTGENRDANLVEEVCGQVASLMYDTADIGVQITQVSRNQTVFLLSFELIHADLALRAALGPAVLVFKFADGRGIVHQFSAPRICSMSAHGNARVSLPFDGMSLYFVPVDAIPDGEDPDLPTGTIILEDS